MTVIGIHRSVTGKALPTKNNYETVPVEQSSKLLVQIKDTKNTTPVNTHVKYMQPSDLLKLLLMCFIVCSVLVFLWQIKETVDQIKSVSSDDKYTFENLRNLISGSQKFWNIQKYKYNTTDADEEFKFSEPEECSDKPVSLRFDCHPEAGVSQSTCTKRQCCWQPQKKYDVIFEPYPLNTPSCYYPDGWSLYKYENFSQDGNDFSGFLKMTGASFYGTDLPLIQMEATSMQDSILRVKIFDPTRKRYEPPWPIRSDPKPFSEKINNPKYKFETDNVKPGFKISRVSDGTTIFNSINVGGFIFSNQFLQISTLLPSHNIYGIGEHRTNLKLNTQWQIFTLFNKDQPPTENANLYGSHPFYLVMEDSGKSHGVLFLNSNAMDVILQPLPALTFRAIGGIFDMYFFLGPTPADVISQYSQIVGKPFFPPYWSLGFHLCRYGYGSLEKTKEVWNRTRAAGIPFDTQWNDLDYMDKNNDFTYNQDEFKDLPQFVEELHRVGMHYIPLIDAGISTSNSSGVYLPYDEGLKQGIFIKNETGLPFMGKVWNLVATVWPDFTHPKAQNYYFEMMKGLHDNFAYDGAWIDMNEPSNFYNGGKMGCTNNSLDYPKYLPNILGGVLATKTLCMNAKHYLGSHYDLHNTYGISQAVATNYALSKIRQKRPFIISRSTWVGSGHYTGHWSGDVYSSWHDLRMSVPEILAFNFYQIPMVGADICGFNGNTSVALCNRWVQLGAFYPFSRNHNSDDTTEQDPVVMGDLVVKSAKRALTIRYWLLPYLYTLFFRAHKFGETVARPLFFEFPNDAATYDIDTQFLWGSSLLINPVLEDFTESVTVYLPRGLWYNLYTKKALYSTGKHHRLNAPLDTIPLMIRGGSILPAQKPGATTTESRKNSLELLVALDENKKAKGELFWDDGDSLDSLEKGKYLWLQFFVTGDVLLSKRIIQGPTDEKIILGRIQILGITSSVSRVFLNNNPVSFKYDIDKRCLSVNGLQLDLRKKFSFYWEYKDAILNTTQTLRE